MQPLAVRHALETATWQSAVDRVLEADAQSSALSRLGDLDGIGRIPRWRIGLV